MKELDKSSLLIKSYKTSFRRGRSEAAYLIDSAGAIILIFAVIWINLRMRIVNKTAALLLTSSLVLMTALIVRLFQSIRFKKHIEHKRAQAKERLIRKRLVFYMDKVADKIQSDKSFICISAESITADDVVKAYKEQRTTIIGVAEPTSAARQLLKQTSIKVVSPEEVLGGSIGEVITITENDIDNEIIGDSLFRKTGINAVIYNIKILSRERAVRYLITGTVLIILSFAVRAGTYYRLMGSLCISVGSVILGYENIRHRANK